MTPFVLCILDGWGIAPESEGNAITRARTPNWDRFQTEGIHSQVEASGPAVGLPEGQMGNSEVGHLNIGAGRIVFQDIVRIDRDIAEGTFADNEVLRGVMERTLAKGKTLHLAGLVGPGGVHSHERHMRALLGLADELELDDVMVHAILDGRDTPPKSADEYLTDLEDDLGETTGRIATVAGRYYTMDRDRRWERTEKGYRAMVHREGDPAASAHAALERAYAEGTTDEFLLPTPVEGGKPVAEGDGFIFVNFRPDRARQITRALADPDFDAFPTEALGLDYVCMTQYEDAFRDLASIAYTPERPTMTLGEHLSGLGVTQLRIAETEKYAHVTYFFSGGREKEFPGEERILVPSPKVATYDLQPTMSAPEVTERLIARLRADDPPRLAILNFANPDMVGHTGVLDASIQACETIDTAMGQIHEAVHALGGTLMVTADHGNVEEMIDSKGGIVTKHTTNPVPLMLLPPEDALPAGTRLKDGILADVAPTILDLMGLPKPDAMDRPSLLDRGT